MDNKFKFKKLNFKIKTVILVVIIVISIILLSFLRKHLKETSKTYLRNSETFAKPVQNNNELLIEFKKMFKERKVILACEEDINSDNFKDLVVISKLKDEISTIAILKIQDKYETTIPIPAPRENQYMKFFDMDKNGTMEILITGEKKGQVGYAIYKYEEGKLIDIFGEGMEDCC